VGCDDEVDLAIRAGELHEVGRFDVVTRQPRGTVIEARGEKRQRLGIRHHGAGAGMRPRMLLAFLLELPSEWCAAKSPRSAAARCPSGVAKYWLRAVSSI